MSRYAFFLGCIAPNRYPGIEASVKVVAPKLGIEVVDMPGASCCPPPGVIRSFDKTTWYVIAARNLAIAESLKADVVVVCNGCYATLRDVNIELKEDPKLMQRVNEVLSRHGRRYEGSVEVHHFIDVLDKDVGVDRIADLAKIKGGGVKVAAHYGCHYVKPSKHRPPMSREYPELLDKLIEALGFESVYYVDKSMCCGAGGGVRSAFLETSLDFTKTKVERMLEAGAEAVVNICSFCHLQFDAGQNMLLDRGAINRALPVVHYAQLLGLCMGVKPEKLGLYDQAISTREFVEKFFRG